METIKQVLTACFFCVDRYHIGPLLQDLERFRTYYRTWNALGPITGPGTL